jgi:hypothetical protein
MQSAPEAHKLQIPSWVPLSAKQAIADQLACPDLAPKMRHVLWRLAGRNEMRTLVWAKLPPEPIEPSDIIWLTLLAFERAIALEPPRPRRGQQLVEHIRKHWKADYLGIAVLARHLHRQLDEGTPVIARQKWREHSGEEFERTMAMVEELASFFDRLDSELREFEAALGFPKPPRKLRGESAETASQRWFSSILSNCFGRIYGRPLDEIVATLETVAFKLPPGEVTAETIHGRRRRQPEHSRRKSR